MIIPKHFDHPWVDSEAIQPEKVGWYPASYARSHCVLRWWDGNSWSLAATPKNTAEEAGLLAAVKCPSQDILWAHPWWE